MIDLRSDTLSKPTSQMTSAMANAAVGDCYYDEDPSVLSLENKVASLFGHEAALFVPSGTMSNQLCMGVWSSNGEAVVVNSDNHIVQYETGALGRLFGIQPIPVHLLNDGISYDADWILENHVAQGTLHAPAWACMSFENTQMKLGGKIHPFKNFEEVSFVCKKLGLGMHLDGARIWNAAVAEQKNLTEYGKFFDSISVCFSKGLGAPVGSCLIGSKAFVQKAKRLRKMLGGTMRQCGIIAAGAEYALTHNTLNLATDHRAAQIFGKWIRTLFPTALVGEPMTNICLIHSKNSTESIAIEEILLQKYEIKIGRLGPKLLRAVTYLDVSNKLINKVTECGLKS